MTNRVYNFGAGPAMLPASVLKQAQKDIINWQELGVSILEVGHRTRQSIDLLLHAEHALRQLLKIPNNYHVLFLGGAARTQFSMIPLNILNPEEQGAYIVNGMWSSMAYDEAKKLKKCYRIAGGQSTKYTGVPDCSLLNVEDQTKYVYYTPNETIQGIRFPFVPKVNDVPLIADMTSCLLTEPIDVGQYGLIFAGAQKNIANAGLTIVIIREDLLHREPSPVVPSMMNYRLHDQHHSLLATPPMFNIYLADLMFGWLKSMGGVAKIHEANKKKASLLYDYIDSTDFYKAEVEKSSRSLVNVCFSLQDSLLNDKFVDLAAKNGLYALKGHRTAGGLRASLYNAMPLEGVEKLVSFMRAFSTEHKRQ